MEESIGSRVARQRPVDATTNPLRIPEILKIIADYAMSPRSMASFCTLRAVNHLWNQTAFDLIKEENSDLFRVSFTESHTRKTTQFLPKVTPNALLPLTVRVNLKDFDVYFATRFARDYSHMVVRLDLSIEGNRGSFVGLEKKLEAFQGRNFSGLKTVNVTVRLPYRGRPYAMHLIQDGLHAIEQLTGSLVSLTHFKLTLECDRPGYSRLVLPSRLTNISLHGWSSFRLIDRPVNQFPGLRALEVYSGLYSPDMNKAVGNQWRRFVENHTKLETLKLLSEHNVPLQLPLLKSLKEIHLDENYFTVGTQRGSDAVPNLTSANLYIRRNLEEGELTKLVDLLRLAPRFTLQVYFGSYCQNGPLRLDILGQVFSNVTKLELIYWSEWETLVLPLSHVFLHMTTLLDIDISNNYDSDRNVDLCCLLTGVRECEISEEENDTILNGRRDVVTNLHRLRSLRIDTKGILEQLGPFLFQSVFTRMPELTKITLTSYEGSMGTNPFADVQEMATTLTGKVIVLSINPRQFPW